MISVGLPTKMFFLHRIDSACVWSPFGMRKIGSSRKTIWTR